MSETSDQRSIERDLDQTRSRLDGHLSELQQRLSPGQVLDDLMGYFRGSEGADFGRSLLENIRTNPMPAALTGIGVAWLMASTQRTGAPAPVGAPAGSGVSRTSGEWGGFDQGGYQAMTTRVTAAEQGVVREHGEADHAYTARLDDARGKAIGLARHAQESTESFSQRVGDTLASAQQAIARSTHDLRDQASGVAGSVGSAVQGAAQSVSSAAQRAGGAAAQGGQKAGQAAGQAGGNFAAMLADNPALLGAIGLAAGALLGALLPQSGQEEAALGGLAGQARDAARSLAQGAVDQGSHVAQAVVDKGRESAEAHGLAGGRSPGDLVDAALSGGLAKDARQVASDVLGAGEEVVRKETLGQGQGDPATR